jgi:glycerophosphoryl diester phosphodiesterase
MSSSPVVIAHRGASGYLPEHTLEAKALAYGLGADYLEQDVVATRDAQLVVLHDLHLDDVTDVARCFPGRSRADGRHYVIDFDLAELKRLTVSERRQPGGTSARFPERFPTGKGSFRIATLDQELDLIAGLNRSMRRNVGIYPEIKDPQWHRDHDIDLSRLLLERLAAHGYDEQRSPAFVQCFDATELRRVATQLRSKLPLIQLIGTEPEYANLLGDEGFRAIAEYAVGIGPSYTQLLRATPPTQTGEPQPGPLVAAARRAGLLLHPYTFRRDDVPGYVPDLETLLTLFFEHIGVDGVFCDHPDVAVRMRNAALARKGSAVNLTSL